MKTTRTLPFISLLLIASMFLAPLIFAFDGGSFGGFDSGASFGGSFGGFDSGAAFGGSFGGTDSGAPFGGSSESTGESTSGGTSGTSGGTGGSFDNPPGFDPTPFPPGGPTPPGDAPFPDNAAAIWQDLPDKTIYQGSSSGTLIQENVFEKCTDPDDDLLYFTIASTSPNFELFFTFDDLRIFGLDPLFIGTETVTLTCNGVPESFLLHVVPKTPGPKDGDDGDGEGDGLSVHIGTIRITNADDATAGDLVPVIISFKNNGDRELENLKATVIIQELGVRASIGPLDVAVGKTVSRTIYADLPEDVQPGEYDVGIFVNSGSLHRAKYRYVDVIA